jgi:L-threonylcarbamoyladenylate synthase
MLGRHYAPHTPLECVDDDGSQRVQHLMDEGLRVGWLTFGEPHTTHRSPLTTRLAMPVDPAAYAAQLYTALHTLDASGVDRIVAALPPVGDAWLAAHDRLRRAAQEG